MKKFLLLLIFLGSSVFAYNFQGEESLQLQDTIFYDHFEDMSNWTILGPLGFFNWNVQNTNLAGGLAAPEMVFRWDPIFIGDSYIISPVIYGAGNKSLALIFNYSIDWWSNIMTVGIAVTSDGGTSYTSIWEFAAGTSYPPDIDTVYFTGIDNMQIALYYTGDSNDADFWYIDDLYLIDLSPLPVELSSFSANVNNNDVELKWTTATELNNKGFEIQRINPPLNPRQGGENFEWEVLEFVNGYGTSTEPKSYSYTDSKISAGKYIYRLKQIDFDGSYSYSKEIEIDVTSAFQFNLEQNYPNPFNPVTTIKYSIADELSVTLKVYNSIGEEVAVLVNETKPAGNYEVELNGAEISSGAYFYMLRAGDHVATKKMILLK